MLIETLEDARALERQGDVNAAHELAKAAFSEYLKSVCEEAGNPLPSGLSFREMVEILPGHLGEKGNGLLAEPRNLAFLSSMAALVDETDALRNGNVTPSGGHPADAGLSIHLIGSMLRYLDRNIPAHPRPA